MLHDRQQPEIPPQERLGIEIEAGARALGLSLPIADHVAAINEVLELSKGLEFQYEPLERDYLNAHRNAWFYAHRQQLFYARSLTSSFAEIGIHPQVAQSAIVLWNPEGSSRSRIYPSPFSPDPHTLWLVRTAYENHREATAIMEVYLHSKEGTEFRGAMRATIPVMAYPIAKIPVGTTEFDFDYTEKIPFLNAVDRNGKVLITKTVR